MVFPTKKICECNEGNFEEEDMTEGEVIIKASEITGKHQMSEETETKVREFIETISELVEDAEESHSFDGKKELAFHCHLAFDSHFSHFGLCLHPFHSTQKESKKKSLDFPTIVHNNNQTSDEDYQQCCDDDDDDEINENEKSENENEKSENELFLSSVSMQKKVGDSRCKLLEKSESQKKKKSKKEALTLKIEWTQDPHNQKGGEQVRILRRWRQEMFCSHSIQQKNISSSQKNSNNSDNDNHNHGFSIQSLLNALYDWLALSPLFVLAGTPKSKTGLLNDRNCRSFVSFVAHRLLLTSDSASAFKCDDDLPSLSFLDALFAQLENWKHFLPLIATFPPSAFVQLKQSLSLNFHHIDPPPALLLIQNVLPLESFASSSSTSSISFPSSISSFSSTSSTPTFSSSFSSSSSSSSTSFSSSSTSSFSSSSTSSFSSNSFSSSSSSSSSLFIPQTSSPLHFEDDFLSKDSSIFNYTPPRSTFGDQFFGDTPYYDTYHQEPSEADSVSLYEDPILFPELNPQPATPVLQERTKRAKPTYSLSTKLRRTTQLESS